ncbi:MAG TPA: winged helix-turn-helix domain-containing protein [Sphingomicrobium sp.]|nr:winged helix-turn-helix domain-containing protein [Sphingomicrobium sp.]
MDRPASWRAVAIDLEKERPFRIGGATIDPVSRDVDCASGKQRLQPQTLKVLVMLAKSRNRVVTRSELVDSCWEGRIIGDDVINRSISTLRQFAERAGGFSIETVPKTGYRLLEAHAPGPGIRQWASTVALAIMAAVAALLLIIEPAQKQGDPPVPTVILTPFTAPPGDALAAEVARGARVSLLRMLAEGGFPVRLAEQASPRSDYHISGDVKRASGNIEATVRMEEMRHHIVIFTHRFDAPETDAGNLPDQIGASLSANLSWTAALMILDKRNPTDPRIMAELLKQMSITVEGGDILQSYEIARKIAPKAPNSAIAQVALAFNSGFVLGALPREQRGEAVALGRKASERALELAPEFGDAHVTWCFLHPRVRRVECEQRVRQGLKADPDGPFPAGFLTGIFLETGRYEEALKFARMSIANDRYKTSKLTRLIRAFEVNGKADEANEIYEQARRWWPKSERIRWGRRMGLIESGNFAGLEKFARTDGANGLPTLNLIQALRERDVAMATRNCTGPDRFDPIEQLCLIVLAELGQPDAAYARAELIYPRMKGRTPQEEERLWLDRPDGHPTGTLAAPSAATLRHDPRFIALSERLGLLDYWRGGRLPDFCRVNPEPICRKLVPARPRES